MKNTYIKRKKKLSLLNQVHNIFNEELPIIFYLNLNFAKFPIKDHCKLWTRIIIFFKDLKIKTRDNLLIVWPIIFSERLD